MRSLNSVVAGESTGRFQLVIVNPYVLRDCRVQMLRAVRETKRVSQRSSYSKTPLKRLLRRPSVPWCAALFPFSGQTNKQDAVSCATLIKILLAPLFHNYQFAFVTGSRNRNDSDAKPVSSE